MQIKIKWYTFSIRFGKYFKNDKSVDKNVRN